MTLTPFLKVLFGKGDGKLLEVVKDTADELIYSKEEKAEDARLAQIQTEEAVHRQETLDHAQFSELLANYTSLVELDVEDKKSAREREVAITTGATTGWLNKNIVPLLALFLLVSTVGMFILLIFKKKNIVAVDMTVVGGIVETFKNLSMLVAGYYFGSSASSAIKTQLINTKNKEE